MSRNKPNVTEEREQRLTEQRLQVLEGFSERLQRLDEMIRELKGASEKTGEKLELVRMTLSQIQGANVSEQVKENKQSMVDQEKRIRALEDARSGGVTRSDYDATLQRIAALEKWQAKLLGIGIVLVLISGFIGAAIMKLFNK